VSIAMLLWNILSVTVVRKKYEITTYYNPFRS